jgi:Xaa-Pro aminopeptidase
MRLHPVSNFLFEKNRAKLARQLPNRSVTILCSNDRMPKNGDQYFPFRQNSNFYYLTGIDEPNSIVIISPDHPDYTMREALFIEKTTEFEKTWTGEKLNLDEAREISGIENVCWIEDFDDALYKIMNHASYIFLCVRIDPNPDQFIPTSDFRLYQKLKRLYPLHHFEDCRFILSRLRQVKEKEEIEQIEEAITVTRKAFYELTNVLEPGLHEYEIEAAIAGEFLRNGVRHHAFQPIVASGKNACILHYDLNEGICQDNDLLLIDFGAEFNNYCADITRTIPVNGKFNERQLQVYNSVLHIMQAGLSIIKKGKTIRDIQQEIIPFVEQELIRLGLISEEETNEKEDIEMPAYQKYFMHSISHFLGIDVHDVGNNDEILQPGMVITCEPGIYIHEENIGIRLENDVLITDNGNINLSESIPIKPDEIEELMRKG